MPRIYKTLTIEDYTITKSGEVINNHTNRIVKPQLNGKGYYRVSIGGKLQFVHRLVADKYIPNPEGKPQVNHKDGNKLNNSADNLEWVTNKENRSHAVEHDLHLSGEKCKWSKLTKEQVVFIRKNANIPTAELARLFGVSRGAIADVKTRKT